MVKINNKNMTKLEKLVTDVAKDLMMGVGDTTTLEIKNELRIRFPEQKFFQSDVHDIMMEFEKNDDRLTFTDNGTHRVYNYRFTNNSSPIIKYLGKKALIQVMKSHAGKFITVEFTKNNSEIRKYNVQQTKKTFMSDLGYLQMKTSRGKIKQTLPENVRSVTASGITYMRKGIQ